MDIDLEELKRLKAAATPLNWIAVEHKGEAWVICIGGADIARCEGDEDADYIAAACNAIPALIERLGRAETELATLREQVRWHLPSDGKPTTPGTYVVLRADQEPDIDDWVFFPRREQGGEWDWETMWEPDGWLGPLPEVKR